MNKIKAKFISFSNFNPVALFSLILLVLGVILGAVSIGIGEWSRLETIRSDDGIRDGATMKSVGLMSRCVSYELSSDIIELGLSLEQQPRSECIAISEVNCSQAGLPLISALDIFRHPEIHNSIDRNTCSQVKRNLEVSGALMITGVVLTAVSLLLFFPFLHWGVTIVADVLTLLTVVLYAAALGVYADMDQHFAGFFSLNGMEQIGCLSYGFGIALASFLVNIIAVAIGVFAVIYAMCFKKTK